MFYFRLAEREELLSRHKIRLLSHEIKVKCLAKDLEMARNRNNKLKEVMFSLCWISLNVTRCSEI
jgi:hypothetical protein